MTPSVVSLPDVRWAPRSGPIPMLNIKQAGSLPELHRSLIQMALLCFF